jgi:RHS repeat-associated protein
MSIHSHLPYDQSTSHARIPAGGIHLIASIDSVSEAQVTASFFGSTKALHGEVATTTAETSTHNHSNQQYYITAVTTSTGAVAERYAYSAYGEPTICDSSGSVIASASINNRYSYTGREWDATVGLHHFRARWMSPNSGRFLGRDPIGYWDGFNSYRPYFHFNDVDPSGLHRGATPPRTGGGRVGGRNGGGGREGGGKGSGVLVQSNPFSSWFPEGTAPTWVALPRPRLASPQTPPLEPTLVFMELPTPHFVTVHLPRRRPADCRPHACNRAHGADQAYCRSVNQDPDAVAACLAQALMQWAYCKTKCGSPPPGIPPGVDINPRCFCCELQDAWGSRCAGAVKRCEWKHPADCYRTVNSKCAHPDSKPDDYPVRDDPNYPEKEIDDWVLEPE